ncbi:hypothetical protein IQ255_27185 [Pleurocapsales cyanobacterium LEGE 10410]|nr:hypothetical protein [Pleurocapsales cyanobacterium LEGE 10410]
MKVKYFATLFAALLSFGLVTSCADPGADVDADPGADVVEPDAGIGETDADMVEPDADMVEPDAGE